MPSSSVPETPVRALLHAFGVAAHAWRIDAMQEDILDEDVLPIKEGLWGKSGGGLLGGWNVGLSIRSIFNMFAKMATKGIRDLSEHFCLIGTDMLPPDQLSFLLLTFQSV